MPKFLEQIKQWFLRFKASRSSYRKDGIHPERDWGILLVSTFVILLISATISFYIYFQIDKDKLFTIKESVSERKVEIDMELFKKTVEDIKVREDSMEALKQNKITAPDPSI